MQLPDDDLQAKRYAIVLAGLERAGYRQYGISNFAKPGKESQHNLSYWQGGEYIGLGVGAHSYKDGNLFWRRFAAERIYGEDHRGRFRCR